MRSFLIQFNNMWATCFRCDKYIAYVRLSDETVLRFRTHTGIEVGGTRRLTSLSLYELWSRVPAARLEATRTGNCPADFVPVNECCGALNFNQIADEVYQCDECGMVHDYHSVGASNVFQAKHYASREDYMQRGVVGMAPQDRIERFIADMAECDVTTAEGCEALTRIRMAMTLYTNERGMTTGTGYYTLPPMVLELHDWLPFVSMLLVSPFQMLSLPKPTGGRLPQGYILTCAAIPGLDVYIPRHHGNGTVRIINRRELIDFCDAEIRRLQAGGLM